MPFSPGKNRERKSGKKRRKKEGKKKRKKRKRRKEGEKEEKKGRKKKSLFYVPGRLFQNLIALSLLTRSSVTGWVLKRDWSAPPLRGFTINMWAVFSFAGMSLMLGL